MRKQGNKSYEWTPELAYAVGLLVTDGNLSSDKRHITLRSKDIIQLKTFKKCLHIDNSIGKTTQRGNVCFRVQFGDVHFYKWLESIGLFQAKSLTIGAVAIPNIYLCDFVRGHLDGDGNVQVYWDKYNSYKGRSYRALRIYTRFISASEAHMRWLRERITKEIGLKGALIKNKPKRQKDVCIWEIKYAKKDSLALYRWMYYDKDVTCLPRKRVLTEKAMKLQSNIHRRKYQFLDREYLAKSARSAR